MINFPLSPKTDSHDWLRQSARVLASQLPPSNQPDLHIPVDIALSSVRRRKESFAKTWALSSNYEACLNKEQELDLVEFAASLESLDSIASLKIENCPWITDSHLEILIKQLPLLKRISLKRCHLITHVGKLLVQHQEDREITVEIDEIKFFGDPSKLKTLKQMLELVPIAKRHPKASVLLDFVTQQIPIEPLHMAFLIDYSLENDLWDLLTRCQEVLNKEFSTFCNIQLDRDCRQDILTFFPMDASRMPQKTPSLNPAEKERLQPLKASLAILAAKRSNLAIKLDVDAFLKESADHLDYLFESISHAHEKVSSLTFRYPDASSSQRQLEDQAKSYLFRCRKLTELNLESFPLGIDTLTDILNVCLSLTSLKIWNCSRILPGHFCQIGPYLKQLKTLMISENQLTKEKLHNNHIHYLLESLEQLEHLELHACLAVDDNAFNHLPAPRQKLRSVILNGVGLLGNKPLTSIGLIEELEISFCENLSIDILSTLSAMPSLLSLRLRFNPKLKEIAYSAPQVRLQRSNSISLQPPPSAKRNSGSLIQLFNPRKASISEEPVKALPPVPTPLQMHFKNLQTLDLSGTPLGDQDLVFIAKHCPNLNHLILNQKEITEETLYILLNSSRSLQWLTAKDCPRWSSFAKAFMSPERPLPSDLKIQSEDGIDLFKRIEWISWRYERERALNVKASKVNSLEIRHCHVSLDHFKLLAGIADQAKSLSLVNSLNDESLVQSLKLFPQLESLTLESDPLGITDSMLAAWPASRHLKKLKLKNNLSVTNTGIAALAQKYPSLKELSLENFSGVNLVGLKYLVESCPCLVAINVDDPEALLLVIEQTLSQPNPKLVEFLKREAAIKQK